MKYGLVYRMIFTQRKQYLPCLIIRPSIIHNVVGRPSNLGDFRKHFVATPNAMLIRSISVYDVLEEQQQSRQYQKQTDEFDQVGLSCLLVKLLQCSFPEAEDLVEQNLKLLKSFPNFEKLENRISVLLHIGVDLSNIQSNLWLLGFDEDDLKCRINLLKRWKFKDLNNGLSLLKLPLNGLARYTLQAEREMKTNNGLNRITYLAANISCEEKQTCEVFVKYGFMLKINMETMKEILKIAKDHHISGQDLLSDPWLFNYTLDFVSARSKLLVEIGAEEKCKVMKPWMLRCKETVLNRCFELKDDNIAALGLYSGLVDLLRHELDLTREEVEDMFLKHPALAKISYSKVKDMIEFLKDLGFSGHAIYLTPRVLCHKQATLSARLEEVKKINPRLITLHNLCRNKKEYDAFIKRMA